MQRLIDGVAGMQTELAALTALCEHHALHQLITQSPTNQGSNSLSAASEESAAQNQWLRFIQYINMILDNNENSVRKTDTGLCVSTSSFLRGQLNTRMGDGKPKCWS